MPRSHFSPSRSARAAGLFLVLLALITALPCGAARAARLSQADVLRIEINIAGRQRMLSQRIASSACLLSLGIDSETHELALLEAQQIYRTTLDRLEKGDPLVGLPPAEDFPTRMRLAEARFVWNPIDRAIDRVLSGEASRAEMLAVAAKGAPLLEVSKAIVTALVAQAAGGGDLALAHAIDMAGRQRMLSQSTVALGCMITEAEEGDFDRAALADKLHAAIALFDDSAATLRAGSAEAQIAAPPGADAAQALERAAESWSRIRPILATAADSQTLDPATLADLSERYELLLPELEDVVWFYVNRSGAQP